MGLAYKTMGSARADDGARAGELGKQQADSLLRWIIIGRQKGRADESG